MSGYFITGTDTGVGKTAVAAALVRRLVQANQTAVGMKPVASGCRATPAGLRNEDAEKLIAVSSPMPSYDLVNPYAFEPAIAPHLAAREIGVRIELETIIDRFETLSTQADAVVVEGVGGWRVPLGRVITTEHMAKALGLPVVLVVGMRLGCLNHALLTVEAVQASGLNLAGWVANQVEVDMPRLAANIDTLASRISAPLLGEIPFLQSTESSEIETRLHIPEQAAS